MKLFGNNKFLYMSPEDGSGGAGAIADPPPPPPPVDNKSFSEEEVNNREAKLRRSFERKMREQEAAWNKKLADLEAKISTPDPAPPPPPGTPQDAGHWELKQRRWEQERQELEARVAEQEKAMKTERENRLKLVRARLLDDALLKAGVSEKNMILARRYFDPDIEWDELDQTYMLKTPSGNLVNIDDGVREYLPDNLKPSKIARGGAGTNGGLPNSNATRAQRALDEAKKKLVELQAAAKKNPGSNALMSQFSQQKQVVRRLEAELSNATK